MIKTPGYLPDLLADSSLSREQREAFCAMAAEMDRMHKQMHDMQQKLHEIEHKAPEEPASILTRPEFNREVARMLAFDERYGGMSSVLYFDIENLASVAEQYGKAVSNAAIREASDLLSHMVRNSDIVGRLAPDEFGVLLVRCNNVDAWKKGQDLAGKLLEILTEVHGCKLNPHISYAAYTFGKDNQDVAAGLKAASELVTRITVKQ
jgi:diguanylate cyclase (GGDEF)-like protein